MGQALKCDLVQGHFTCVYLYRVGIVLKILCLACDRLGSTLPKQFGKTFLIRVRSLCCLGQQTRTAGLGIKADFTTNWDSVQCYGGGTSCNTHPVLHAAPFKPRSYCITSTAVSKSQGSKRKWLHKRATEAVKRTRVPLCRWKNK